MPVEIAIRNLSGRAIRETDPLIGLLDRSLIAAAGMRQKDISKSEGVLFVFSVNLVEMYPPN